MATSSAARPTPSDWQTTSSHNDREYGDTTWGFAAGSRTRNPHQARPKSKGGTTMATTMRNEIKVGELTIRFLVEGEQSGGSVAVFEFDVPAGSKVAAGHSHDGYEETIYGLEGVLTWTVEGMPIDVRPGEALLIPRGAVHHFDNTRDIDAKALAIVTPGILGPDYFEEVAAILDAAAGGPPDFAALGEVMRKHGLTCAE
jgi:quercetin dioxygenase-like cupin family protein